jgi:hypothetical protein
MGVVDVEGTVGILGHQLRCGQEEYVFAFFSTRALRTCIQERRFLAGCPRRDQGDATRGFFSFVVFVLEDLTGALGRTAAVCALRLILIDILLAIDVSGNEGICAVEEQPAFV